MKPFLQTIGAIILSYFAVSWMAFQYRNPKANRMTFYSEFTSVVTWKTLRRFQ